MDDSVGPAALIRHKNKIYSLLMGVSDLTKNNDDAICAEPNKFTNSSIICGFRMLSASVAFYFNRRPGAGCKLVDTTESV